jgi:hypothetical protein
MGCHSGTRIQNATELKKLAPSAGNRVVMIHPNGKQDDSDRFLAYCDITSDANIGWHLVFTAFPRAASPYVDVAVDTSNRSPSGTVPLPTDTSQHKFDDADIKTILNAGLKQTRTQWWHTSVEFGTVWGDGSLSNISTMYNEFDNPNAWSSSASSAGATFRRKRGLETAWSGTITSGSTSGCSGPVGGWSNYYEQSCTQSWFAGCEGGPAFNHRCAGGIQDRAEKLLIWAA